MADDAIRYINELNQVAPGKPFLLNFAPGGTHAPHHPTKEWIEKIGKLNLFDKGWNALREQILANQKRLGVVPANTQLTPWPKDLLPDWDSLGEIEKKLFIKQAEVYAAYLAYTDHEIGRVIQAVEDAGQLENTLIIYISGDNGSSAEGSLVGTPNEVGYLNGAHLTPDRAAAVVSVLGLGPDLPAHGGALDVGIRHAVQVDQAGRLALRRHAPGHGDFVAQGDQGQGRHPHPVPSRHRHRADHPRSRAHQAAENAQRHCAETDGGREHDVHLRQEERERTVDAQDAVLRDVRQPRDLQRWLGRGNDAAGGAVDDGPRQDAAM